MGGEQSPGSDGAAVVNPETERGKPRQMPGAPCHSRLMFRPTLLLLVGITAVSSTSCYECNSAEQAVCANEFDETRFASFEVDCDDPLSHPEGDGDWTPVGCRKIVQWIKDTERIVRQCAYSGESASGHKRAGNDGYKAWYYQCVDKDYCNSASKLRLSIFLLILVRAF